MRPHRPTLAAIAAAVLLTTASRPAAAQWTIESKDGTSNVKIGFLAQPQIETVDTPDTTGNSTNLFVKIQFHHSGDILERPDHFPRNDLILVIPERFTVDRKFQFLDQTLRTLP